MNQWILIPADRGFIVDLLTKGMSKGNLICYLSFLETEWAEALDIGRKQ